MRRFDMKRMIVWSLGVLLLAAPVFAGEKGTSKSQSMTGKVTAVNAGSFTVKVKGGERTFATDRSTVIVLRGATRKMAALEAANKPAILTEFVGVGNDVRVKYRDMGESRHAAKVTVLWAPATLYASR
jgi:hypothetical protein